MRKIIDEQKKSLMTKIERASQQFEKIYIFGAGRTAEIVSRLLQEYKISFHGYCVSETKENLKAIGDKAVIGIQEVNEKKDEVFFIIATRPSKSQQVAAELNERGYTNYVELPLMINYFDQKQYMETVNPEMEITVRIGCRVNCKYCPQTALLKRYQGTHMMTFDIFKTCVDKLPMDTTIVFSGFCEPFLNDECVNMILYAFEMKRKVKLFTTLEGLTSEAFDKIRKLNFEEVVLHLPDEKGYANITVNDEYFELLNKVIDSKKENGEDFINHANSQVAVLEKVMNLVQGRVRLTGEMHSRAGNLEDEELVTCKADTEKKRFCKRALELNHNVLLPNGDVVMCCNDFGLAHKFGNLLTDSYDTAVVNSEERARILHCLSNATNEKIICNECSYVEYYGE